MLKFLPYKHGDLGSILETHGAVSLWPPWVRVEPGGFPAPLTSQLASFGGLQARQSFQTEGGAREMAQWIEVEAPVPPRRMAWLMTAAHAWRRREPTS